MKRPRGFTLIELLVVIAIIGILAAIVFSALGGSRAKGRDAKRVSDLRQIAYALDLYYDINGKYPACLYASGCTGTHLEGSTYMPTPPKDPNGGLYSYAGLGSGANCSDYHLGTSLEDKTNVVLQSDADAAAAGTVCTGSAADFNGLTYNAGGATCSASPTDGVAQPTGNVKGETCFDLKE